MDLKSTKKKGVCEITAPDGSSTDIKISVYGSGSKEYMQAVRKLTDENAGKDITASLNHEAGVKLLASVTAGWEGVEEQGEALVFSQEEAERIYDEYPWIAKQVDEFIGKNKHFF